MSLQQTNPVRVPTGETEEEEDQLGTMDFAVTRDFSILKDTVFPASYGLGGNVQPKVRKKDLELEQVLSSESNLHELSM